MLWKEREMNLCHLIDPIDPDTFKSVYWEKKPLRIARNDPGYYREFLSLADMDHLLANSTVHPSQVRVVHEGKEIRIGARNGGRLGTSGLLEELYAAYRGGSTLLLQAVHERWRPLRLLCQSLSTEFSARFHVNTYLTPAHEKGFTVHYDSHDVFILQSHGVKRWYLYESSVQLPLKGQPYDAETMPPGPVLDEFDLHAGDFLYIPRGCVHAAASCDTASQHLTIGVHTVTWATVLLRAVESEIERDVRFRESLPLGFARDPELQEGARADLRNLLSRLANQVDSAAAIQEAVEEAYLGRQPALEGHLLDLEDVEHIGLTTRLRRRRDGEWRLARAGNTVSLRGHGKSINMPGHTWTELSFIVGGPDEFCATDFPSALDADGRVTLVRSLVREGFLTICRAAD
jgi:ribosomal protein L16 Arg81 hydroxylase